MSSTTNLKIWRFKNLFSSTCGCGCSPPTATDAIQPKTIKLSERRRRRAASTNTAAGILSPCAKINDSLAVVKDFDDPYRDFRQSMVEMISEKEIYSRSDLQHLLRCFLDLNPPSYHQIIVTAFMDIWNAAAAVDATDNDIA